MLRRRFMKQEGDGIVDLSLQDIYGNPINRSTANCYVVSKPGKYKFPWVLGNAIKNGKVNTAAFTNNGGSYSHNFVDGDGVVVNENHYYNDYEVSFVELVNSDEDVISNLHLEKEDGMMFIHFTINGIPNNGANCIIRGGSFADAVGEWSWHIWLWPHDLSPVEITNATGVTYNIMPVNLASKYDSDGTHIKNWFYQWGRPNPLLCPNAWNSTTDHSTGSITKSAKASNLNLGLKYPTTFFYNSDYPYNWFGTKSYYNLWDAACTSEGNSDNDTVKTVYDPCPVGWKIPNENTFTGLSILSSANGIVKMARYSGDAVGVGFAMSGRRNNSDGSLGDVGSAGFVCLSSGRSQIISYNLYFNSDSFNPQSIGGLRAYGFSVRPVQDDLTDIDPIIISFTINGTTYAAESGMTWLQWTQSSYNTGGYTSTGGGTVCHGGSIAKALEYNGNRVMKTDVVIGGAAYTHST